MKFSLTFLCIVLAGCVSGTGVKTRCTYRDVAKCFDRFKEEVETEDYCRETYESYYCMVVNGWRCRTLYHLEEVRQFLSMNCAPFVEVDLHKRSGELNADDAAEDESLEECLAEEEDYIIHGCTSYDAIENSVSPLRAEGITDDMVLGCYAMNEMSKCFITRTEDKCGTSEASLLAFRVRVSTHDERIKCEEYAEN